MKTHLKSLTPVLAVLFLAVAALRSNAQITNPIQAHIGHSFMIGDKTLPPGDYTFHIEPNTDLGVMDVQTKNGDNVAQVNIRQSLDNHRPKHSELIFRKYGNTEFLSKVYESGSKEGVAVTETGKEEQRLVQEGQHALEHTEEQQ